MTATITRPVDPRELVRRVETRLAPSGEQSGPPSRWIRTERYLSFFLPLAALVPASAALYLHYHSIIGDAISREANGYYVFFSNDPHLAAIGFVWNPLTTITEMPLILLKGVFPALTNDGYAAALTGCFFMAGACYQLVRLMQELAVRPLVRWVLLGCFLLNPMIYYYGSNGMSEALFIFILVATTRRLAAWLHADRTRDLVASGVWLGLGYAARNEAAMAAVLASGVVLVVSYVRQAGNPSVKRAKAITDSVLFCAPFAVSFIGWAATSWLIVGHPFEQFSSVYGTSSQLRMIAKNHFIPPHSVLLRMALGGIESLAPLLPALGIAAAIRSWRERDTRFLAVLSILGGTVAFEFAAYSRGYVLDSYRYLIYTIPLSVVLAAFLARPAPKSSIESDEELLRHLTGKDQPYLALRKRRRVAGSLGLAIASVLLVLPGVFTTYHEMFFNDPGQEEQNQLSWIVYPGSRLARQNSDFSQQFRGIRREADFLDSLHAGRGQIMLDDADGCVPQIILLSRHPKQFAIPNDINFVERLGAPYEDGVRYMLVEDPGSLGGALDSLDREWPTLYQSGAGLGKLVGQSTLPACTTFRLYRLYPVNA